MYAGYNDLPTRKDHKRRRHIRTPGVSKQKSLHIALTIYGTIVFFIFFFVVLVSLTGTESGRGSYGVINERRVFSKSNIRKLVKVGGSREDDSWKKELIYRWNKSDVGAHQTIIKHHTSGMVKEFVGLRMNQEDFSQRFNTCALVSNSGQLLNSRAGEEIDQADCIIRMNNAPTGNYSQDVGNRTTIRVCSFQAIGNIKKDIYMGREKADYVFMWGMDNPRRRSWSRLRLRKLANMFPNQRFFTLRNRGEQMAEAVYTSETGIDRVSSNSWLSTGWFTMLLGLEICKELRVYGLVGEDYCRTHNDTKVPYHYYEEQKYDECEMYNLHESSFIQGHRYLTEKSVFHRFGVMFNISFRHPAWDLQSYNHTKLYSPFLKKWTMNNTAKAKTKR